MTTPMQLFLAALEPDLSVPHIFTLLNGDAVRTRWGFNDDETEAALRSANEDGWHIFVAINGFSVWQEGKVWIKEFKKYTNSKHAVDRLVPWEEGMHKPPARRAWAMDVPRAVYVDVDEPNAPGGGNGAWPAEVPAPSITVESSDGKRQHYWLLDKADAKANRGHQRHDNEALADALGGDPSCVDAARILRVPGFKNWKYGNGPVVRILHLNEARRFRLPILTKKKATAPSRQPPPNGAGWVSVDIEDAAFIQRASLELERLKYALEHDVLLFGADPTVKAMGRGSDARIYRAANSALDWLINVPPHQQVDRVFQFLEPWFSAGVGDSPQKGDLDYLRAKIEHALRYRAEPVGGKVVRLAAP